ncbi:MAG TPA: hypothetical protein VLX92_04895, partial [Kofleriaceae bacterium]|nr:hypothetical protein [Kofleriaceae bacterium]
ACTMEPQATYEYPVHPMLRRAAGGPILLLGRTGRTIVPYFPGITLRTALQFVDRGRELDCWQVAPTAMLIRPRPETTPPDLETVRDRSALRGFRTFAVPVCDVVRAEVPDVELAPGDVIDLAPEPRVNSSDDVFTF